MTHDETKQTYAALCEAYAEIQRLNRVGNGVVFNPTATQMVSDAMGMIEDTYPDVDVELAEEAGQVAKPSIFNNIDLY